MRILHDDLIDAGCPKAPDGGIHIVRQHSTGKTEVIVQAIGTATLRKRRNAGDPLDINGDIGFHG